MSMTLKLAIKTPLNHFNLDINVEVTGEGIIGLFGPSGSGKTSILRAIAGLSPRSQGNIEFNQYQWSLNANQSTKNSCDVGMVFQDSRLFNHLTIAKNLSIVNKIKSVQQCDRLIEDFGVKPLLNKYGHQLSAGQQQRVAIVRSLLAQPQLLLLDEPLSALDILAKQEIMLALKQYSQQHQLPMIYVSHHIDEINYLCHQLILIEQGTIIDSGLCSSLLKHHQLLAHHGNVIATDPATQQITLQLSNNAYKQLAKNTSIILSNHPSLIQ